MNIKKVIKKINELIDDGQAQALTEYLVVMVFIGLAMVGVIAMMKWPISSYLKTILEVIAITR